VESKIPVLALVKLQSAHLMNVMSKSHLIFVSKGLLGCNHYANKRRSVISVTVPMICTPLASLNEG
jgi:hypothetical protein